jgi:hypothetical protein
MNLDSSETMVEEGSLPDGYSGWAEVPDCLVPVQQISGSVVGKIASSSAQRAYLKGQLQLDWLVALTNSGHAKALQVALAVKIQMDRRREAWVKPPYQILQDLGVSKMDLSRCTKALEKVGLIEVQRRNGRPPLVRLVPWRG